MIPRSRSARVVIVVVGALIAVFVLRSALGETHLERLQALPEGQLGPPDGVLVGEGGHEAEWNLFAPDSTQFTRIYGSDLEPEAVADHFRSQIDLTEWNDRLGCFGISGRERVFTAARARAPGGTARDVPDHSRSGDVFDLCVWEVPPSPSLEASAPDHAYYYLVEVWDRDSEPRTPFGLPTLILAFVVGGVVFFVLVPLALLGITVGLISLVSLPIRRWRQR